MAEETTPKDLADSSESVLPDGPVGPNEPSAATAEAIKKAPEAVRRSMPMALSIMLGILLASLAGWFFYNLTWFILLLYLSFVAATILEAPVQWLKRHRIRRGFSAVIVMVTLLALVGGTAYLVTTGIYAQVSALRDNLEKAPERINHFVNSARHHFMPHKAAAPAPAVGTTAPAIGGPSAVEATAGTAPAATSVATTSPQSQPGDIDYVSAALSHINFSSIWQNAMSGVESVSWLVIMFFIILYMLVDGADHLKGVRCLLPKHSRLEATRFFNELAKGHRGWALASLSNVASATILTSAGLYLVGVPGALILGLFAGLGELIPNIGPVLGAMPAILFTLVADPERFFYVVMMFVIVQTIQSYTISPMMLKFSVELPVLVTIISVLVFGTLFGFLGILVAIPLVADMVVGWQYFNRYIEKDTDDYDQVNTPAYGVRTPMSPDNTKSSRLRKLFRRDRRNAGDSIPAPASAEPTPPDPAAHPGLDHLEKAERRTGAACRTDEPRRNPAGDPARP